MRNRRRSSRRAKKRNNEKSAEDSTRSSLQKAQAGNSPRSCSACPPPRSPARPSVRNAGGKPCRGPTMSRGKFLKTAAVGAAVVGTAAVGLSGVAKAQTPTSTASAYYLGEDFKDTTTLGEWYVNYPGDGEEGSYGNCAWILCGMLAPPHVEWDIPPYENDEWPQPPYYYIDEEPYPEPGDYEYHYYDIYGGPLFEGECGLDYKIYTCAAAGTCDERALIHPNESKRRATCYWSSGTQSITINIPDTGTYQIAIYVLDWDSYDRAESITVTRGTSSDSHTVSNFHEGIYAIFEVSGGGDVGISITKTGGANAVVSGIFVDKISATPPIVGAQYIQEDSDTKGDWIGKYGGDWYLLCAMDSIHTKSNTQPEDKQYDVDDEDGSPVITYTLVSNGNYWAWTDYCTVGGGCNVLEQDKQKAAAYAWSWGADTTEKGLLVPPEEYVIYPEVLPDQLNTAAWASCHDDGGEGPGPSGEPDMYYELTLPQAGPCSPTSCYHVWFYATDYDSTCRHQAIIVYDAETGEELARTHTPDLGNPGSESYQYGKVGDGVYHGFWASAGHYLVKIDYYGCTNAILSGIFVDCMPCPGGSGEFRTIGFWKHQFSVLVNGKGKAQVHKDPEQLEIILNGYLATINDYSDLFTPTSSPPLTIQEAYEILWPNRGETKPTLCDKAKQQALALWLNMANGAATPYEDMSDYGYATFLDLMGYVEGQISVGTHESCEFALSLADELNNSASE